VVYEPDKVRRIAGEAIRKAAQTKDDPADLINVALEELVRQRCELPGYTTLDAMATAIRTEVNTGFHAMVVRRLSPANKARLGDPKPLLKDETARCYPLPGFINDGNASRTFIFVLMVGSITLSKVMPAQIMESRR
jgi:hypothetical protein